MKKFLALLLATLMVMSVLVACGDNGEKAAGDKTAAEKTTQDASASSDSSTVDGAKAQFPEDNGALTILYPGDESDRFREFLDGEFAEVMKNDLNMTVKLTWSNWNDYWTKKDVMLAAQENVDLYWDGLPDLSTMVNKKQCQPLDDLVAAYAADMLKVLPMEQLNGGRVDGVLYAIPSAYAASSAMYQMVTVRQDLLEEVGMTEITTPDDMYKFSELIMAKRPEIKGGGDSMLKPLMRYFGDEQYQWVARDELVVFGMDTKKCYSLFETEGFKKVCEFNRKQTLAGLMNDEVTIASEDSQSRILSGLYTWVEGSVGKELEIIHQVRENAPGANLKSYLLAPEKPRYITAAGGEAVCIPYSAKNPVGAMRFMNWLYATKEHYNMAIYGVEGKDFAIENNRIKKISTNDFFYEWMFRNKNYQMFDPEVTDEEVDMFKNWDNDAIYSDAFGFRFDNSSVKEIETQLIEIKSKEMMPVWSGFADFETELPRVNKKLKDAGMDEYVAEVQRQMDAYLASKK